MGIQAEEAEAVLESVGFIAEMRQKPIASLSGGWKMKLALGAVFVFPLRHLLRSLSRVMLSLGLALAAGCHMCTGLADHACCQPVPYTQVKKSHGMQAAAQPALVRSAATETRLDPPHKCVLLVL